ncbi:MAG: peptidoglycan editing factor PgeF [Lachnospiraceae bacterium]|nr:peptidoglycan editing factor PgeF [Lachnospiraceae bacterium]
MHEYLEKIRQDKVPLIRYDLFSDVPFLVHGFTTRLGGVSEGIYTSMNLSFTRGDRVEDVLANYEILAQEIGIEKSKFVASDQTHTTNIRIVTKDDLGKGIIREKDYTDVDGLMTNEKGVVLFTYYADCVPLFFADKKKKVIALSHSGWRGTKNKMAKVTVEKMCEVYGCERSDIICAIGPSICRSCYEVSQDVKTEFEETFLPEAIADIFTAKANGKFLLDLWKANELILKEAGILEEHIENRRICTCCNKDILFSHRGLEGKRGNLAAFMAIKE